MNTQLTRRERALAIAAAALLTIVVALAIAFLRKGPKAPDQDLVKELLQAKEEVIAAKQQAIDLRDQDNRRIDTVLTGLFQQSDALAAEHNKNLKTINSINETLKDIPGRYAAIADNDDSLRAAFARRP